MPEPDQSKRNSSDEQHQDEDSSLSKSEQLIREYLARNASGEKVDPKEYLKKYPELEEDLLSLFEEVKVNNCFTSEKLASGLKQAEIPKTIGDFVIIRELGRGGMGTVYEAEQVTLKRKVALKILPSHLSFSDEAVVKFRREAEAGGRQSHPGIVAVHAVGVQDGIHFIAQELVENGTNLADHIQKLSEDGNLPQGYFREAALLIAEIAEALHHAHDVGVIHRDIKPSNILLTQDGNPKVTDFGLAKVEDALSLSRSGELMGTPYYMSPEQAASRRIGIDHRTDIFSLGVTLYELLTLRRPFEGKDAQIVLRNILLAEPKDPRKLNPRVPRDLAVITLKALEKLPDRRFQTMDEFSSDLRRFLDGEMILAKPAGPVTQVWKRVKRNPMISFAVSISILALLILVVVVPWIIAQKERENIQEVLRLSDATRLRSLIDNASYLWPAYPETIDRYEEWLRFSEELRGRLELHQERLNKIREDALIYTDANRINDIKTNPKYKELLTAVKNKDIKLEKIRDLEASVSSSNTTQDAKSEYKKNIIKNRQEIADLEEQIAQLENVVAKRRTWLFDDANTQWQHDVLQELVAGLKEITKKDGLIDEVKKRLSFANNVKTETIEKPSKAWVQAIAFIEDPEISPIYDGLKIKPQIGLIPIGQDPESKLWEFAHLQSGEIPKRDNRGKLIYNEDSGMIFVLIPGGSFTMGCMKPDESSKEGDPNVYMEASNDESPNHDVTIAPFFLSKFEMTQGQWLRFTKNNPSCFKPETKSDLYVQSLQLPVEEVSWFDCIEVLSNLNLRLPSESEWEYAARAGTSTPWWTGAEKKLLLGAANIADEFFHKIRPDDPYEIGFEDGHYLTCPVSSTKPNPFGLHEICGNVWEWCQDEYVNSYEDVPCDGSSRDSELANFRVSRGGSYYQTADCCRSSYRDYQTPKYSLLNQGVRPALSLIRTHNND